MGKNKLTWFRIYVKDAEVLEMLGAEAVYKALLSSMRYLEEYIEDEGKSVLSDMESEDKDANLAFCILKKGVDESISEYYARVEDGKRGAAAKKAKRESLPKPP